MVLLPQAVSRCCCTGEPCGAAVSGTAIHCGAAVAAGMASPLDPPPWLCNMAAHGLPPGYSVGRVAQAAEEVAAEEDGAADEYEEIQVGRGTGILRGPLVCELLHAAHECEKGQGGLSNV